MQTDALDARLIRLLTAYPQLPVLECARRLGVARGTVTSRLARLRARGVVTDAVPVVEPAGLGFGLTAVCSVDIVQGVGHEEVAEALLRAVPEVTDLDTVTGDHDLHLRVVARDGEGLQAVLDRIASVRGVARTSSSIALKTHARSRTLELLHAVTDGQSDQ